MKYLELKGKANVRTAGITWSLSEGCKQRTIAIILLALFMDALIFLKLLEKVNIIQLSRSRLNNTNLKLQKYIYFSLNGLCSMSTSVVRLVEFKFENTKVK